MTTAKVGVTIDRDLLAEVDLWVTSGQFPNRSQAFQAGLMRLRDDHSRHTRVLRELAKLDPLEERGMADEILAGEEAWFQY